MIPAGVPSCPEKSREMKEIFKPQKVVKLAIGTEKVLKMENVLGLVSVVRRNQFGQRVSLQCT